ncbi:MAG TPA: nuclear transport factor 2 family protein, partial [Acidimicrobiia bacterium]|nr:nuclear transport factor 2 family protein [Acidimicrobiia bacterium]
MGSSADRAAVLVQAIEASVTGDSRVVRELYADDVQGWSPVMTVSSAAELAVELEDRQEAFSDIDLDVTPLDVGADQACVEWIATATHSGPLVIDEDVVIEPTGGRF